MYYLMNFAFDKDFIGIKIQFIHNIADYIILE